MNDERLAEMFKESQEICRGLERENKEIRERNVIYLNKLKSLSQALRAERAKVEDLQKSMDITDCTNTTLYSALSDREWISVDDRFPNNQTETIIFGDGQVLTGFVYYEQDGVFMDCMDTIFDVNEVTHWMPLPKPPENI